MLVKDIMPLVDDGELEEEYEGVEDVIEVVVAISLLPIVGEGKTGVAAVLRIQRLTAIRAATLH